MCINWDILFKTVAALVAIAGVWKGLMEYRRAQRWKRAEFLSREMKEILGDFNVKRALLILDWYTYRIPLKENAKEKNEFFVYKDELLQKALIHHSDMTSDKFGTVNATIRHIFDSLFERLTILQNHIDNDLFTVADLKPYLGYYLDIIGNPENDLKKGKPRNMIWHYLFAYRYHDVIRLLASCGYPISDPMAP